MKITAVIPAHLASIRFPRKILFPFYGLPMIEHVRRRTLMSQAVCKVYVATSDKEIADVVEGHGGDVIMTGNYHSNGSSRVAEAISQIDCTHVILLQGDEPLMLPSHVDAMADALRANPDGDAWNATGPIESPDELDRHSFVKCCIGKNNQIMQCFRRTPFFSNYEIQRNFTRKILGLIVYRREFLMQLMRFEETPIEKEEFIEQMRIIENGYNLNSVEVSPSLPSVNEPEDAVIIQNYIKNNPEQQELLKRVMDQLGT
jgi:3-deoxy-manno-octulosonate cytidylyltransferase (CMP-KDO synthetase)